jgi:hypothetical protein
MVLADGYLFNDKHNTHRAIPALQYCNMTTCLSQTLNTVPVLSKNYVFVVAGA